MDPPSSSVTTGAPPATEPMRSPRTLVLCFDGEYHWHLLRTSISYWLIGTSNEYSTAVGFIFSLHHTFILIAEPEYERDQVSLTALEG